MMVHSCSYCERPVQGYCGRCGVRICSDHIDLHRVHTSPTLSSRLLAEVEEVLAAIDVPPGPEPIPELYKPDPSCASCQGEGLVPIFTSSNRTHYETCRCRFVAR